MFRHKHAAHAVLDCFGNAAMLRRKHWQPAGHCFEHRIWDAFLISVKTGLARMQENVRRIIDIAQLLLRNKTGKRNALVNLKLAGQILELGQQRTFSSNRQRRIRILPEKIREGAERDRQTFLLDQPASLRKSPFALATAGREAPFAKRKFLQRNSGSLDFDLFWVAAKIDGFFHTRISGSKWTAIWPK